MADGVDGTSYPRLGAAQEWTGGATPAGVVIEHDPDEGCRPCRFGSHEMGTSVNGGPCVNVVCAIAQRSSQRDWGDDDGPAPTWCPLRTGPVTVRRPSREPADEGMDRQS